MTIDLGTMIARLHDSEINGPPMTLSNAAAARVRLIVWCGVSIAATRSSPAPLPTDSRRTEPREHSSG